MDIQLWLLKSSTFAFLWMYLEGQGDLVSRLIVGIIRVAIWVLGCRLCLALDPKPYMAWGSRPFHLMLEIQSGNMGCAQNYALLGHIDHATAPYILGYHKGTLMLGSTHILNAKEK